MPSKKVLHIEANISKEQINISLKEIKGMSPFKTCFSINRSCWEFAISSGAALGAGIASYHVKKIHLFSGTLGKGRNHSLSLSFSYEKILAILTIKDILDEKFKREKVDYKFSIKINFDLTKMFIKMKPLSPTSLEISFINPRIVACDEFFVRYGTSNFIETVPSTFIYSTTIDGIAEVESYWTTKGHWCVTLPPTNKTFFQNKTSIVIEKDKIKKIVATSWGVGEKDYVKSNSLYTRKMRGLPQINRFNVQHGFVGKKSWKFCENGGLFSEKILKELIQLEKDMEACNKETRSNDKLEFIIDGVVSEIKASSLKEKLIEITVKRDCRDNGRFLIESNFIKNMPEAEVLLDDGVSCLKIGDFENKYEAGTIFLNREKAYLRMTTAQNSIPAVNNLLYHLKKGLLKKSIFVVIKQEETVLAGKTKRCTINDYDFVFGAEFETALNSVFARKATNYKDTEGLVYGSLYDGGGC